jgi:hypothetical protein
MVKLSRQELESVLKIRHWQTFDRETSPKSGFFERKTEFQNTLLDQTLWFKRADGMTIEKNLMG